MLNPKMGVALTGGSAGLSFGLHVTNKKLKTRKNTIVDGMTFVFMKFEFFFNRIIE